MLHDLHLNQALAHHRDGRLDAAAAIYDRILGSADNLQARHMLGLVRWQQGRDGEAIALLEAVAAADPNDARVRLELGLAYLRQGDFARGLPLYEARKALGCETRDYPQPLWTGAQDIRGRTLLAYVEQGLGDAIQYLRYARMVDARVIVQVADPLVALLKTSGIDVIGARDTPPPFDYHIPLASIPLAMGMTLGTIPSAPSYLSADPARVAQWRERLGGHGRRIGIAWQGKEQMLGEEGKSVPLSAFSAITGARLISLQKGSDQQAPFVERYDFDTGRDAFLDTAAMMMACERVIACDTSVAHLAGALGVPCWVALKHPADWRWFTAREDTPWYPSLRLFRQNTPGDWTGVFAEMAAAISHSR